MEHFSDRTKMMLGDGYERLKGARVAVFGIGGVGGYAVEALARAGIGSLVLVDSDTVSVSNINRQIIATKDTVGSYKTEAARERILSINPDCKVELHTVFFTKETGVEFDFSSYDYVIDAIDSLTSKIELISAAKKSGTKIISAMGAGNKLDPTRFKVADISKTSVCPLARAVRLELRKRGINHLKVVFSDEPPFLKAQSAKDRAESKAAPDAENTAFDEKNGINPTPCSEKSPTEKEKYDARTAPGSLSFVPSVMGLILAGEVIKDIAFS